MPGEEWNWSEIRAASLRFARRHTNDQNEAEDIAQEATIRAWRYREHLRDGNRRWEWVAKIVQNEAARQQARRVPELLSDGLLFEAAGEDLTPRAVERVDLQAALDRLNPQDRLLIELRYTEDMTQPAIARLLNMPEGTVKVRLHRARGKLQRAFPENGY